jgi:hypothetical protein
VSTSSLSGQIDWAKIDRHRRCFLGTKAMTIAAARLGIIGTADAQSTQTQPAGVPAVKPRISRTLVRAISGSIAGCSPSALERVRRLYSP